MNMRTKLSEWADRTFGDIHHQDFFHINEIGEADKQQNDIMHIVMELKKEQGWKKDWTSDETIERWEKEIMSIVGDNGLLKIEMKSAEANENKFLAGMMLKDGKETFESTKGKIFGYRFRLEIIKK